MSISELLLIVLTSAGFSSIVNGLFRFVNKWMDQKQKKREKEYLRQEKYFEKKEKVYIAALERLLQIRRGFDYTWEDVVHDKMLKEEIDKGNSAFIEISPQLRLYSTDSIFDKWHWLAREYREFAYAHLEGRRLFEESKWAFDFQITMLARQMQDDLGYREFNKSYNVIKCPKCKREHDLISKCPKCGMTLEKLQEMSEEVIREQIKKCKKSK